MISRLISKLKNLVKTKRQKEYKRWFKLEGDINFLIDYDLKEKALIFDVGGYKGQWASDIFSKTLSDIYLFEPINEFSEFSKKRFKKNKKIKVFEFGLSGKTRNERISSKGDESSTVDNERGEIISLKDIKEFIEEKKIKKVDLISMNIEGGEYELLRRMLEEGLVTKFKNIQIQFHEIGRNFKEKRDKIRKGLSKTHKQKYCFPFVWESWEIKNDIL